MPSSSSAHALMRVASVGFKNITREVKVLNRRICVKHIQCWECRMFVGSCNQPNPRSRNVKSSPAPHTGRISSGASLTKIGRNSTVISNSIGQPNVRESPEPSKLHELGRKRSTRSPSVGCGIAPLWKTQSCCCHTYSSGRNGFRLITQEVSA